MHSEYATANHVWRWDSCSRTFRGKIAANHREYYHRSKYRKKRNEATEQWGKLYAVAFDFWKDSKSFLFDWYFFFSQWERLHFRCWSMFAAIIWRRCQYCRNKSISSISRNKFLFKATAFWWVNKAQPIYPRTKLVRFLTEIGMQDESHTKRLRTSTEWSRYTEFFAICVQRSAELHDVSAHFVNQRNIFTEFNSIYSHRNHDETTLKHLIGFLKDVAARPNTRHVLREYNFLADFEAAIMVVMQVADLWKKF